MSAEIDQLRKQLAKTERINEILKKNGELLCQGRTSRYPFMQNHDQRFDLAEMGGSVRGLAQRLLPLARSRAPGSPTAG